VTYMRPGPEVSFEPLTLHYRQFGFIGFAALLMAFLPLLLTIPPITHKIGIRVDQTFYETGTPNFEVSILNNSEIQLDGSPVSLDQLENIIETRTDQYDRDITDSYKPWNVVKLHTEPCALYDTVLRVLAVIRRAGVGVILLDFNNIEKDFGKSWRVDLDQRENMDAYQTYSARTMVMQECPMQPKSKFSDI